MISTQLHPWSPKLLWLVVPSMAAAALWWYIVDHTLKGQVGFTSAALPTLLMFLIFGVFAFGMWLGIIGLLAYISRSWLVRLAGAVAVTWPILLWFPLSVWTGAAAGLTLLGVWWGLERSFADQHNRLTVRPQFTLGTGFSVTVTIIIAAVSLLYYQQLLGSTRSAQELANRLSSQTITLAERFLPVVYKDYRSDQTVDEVLLSQFPTAEEILEDINFSRLDTSQQAEAEIRDRLSQLDIDPDTFNVNSEASQEQIRNTLRAELDQQRGVFLAETRQRLAEQLGVPLKGDEKIHDVLTDLVNKQFERTVKNYVTAIPWLLAAALFFLLKIFTGIFVLALTWLGWGMERLLRALHIVRIDHEMVPAEKLEWT